MAGVSHTRGQLLIGLWLGFWLMAKCIAKWWLGVDLVHGLLKTEQINSMHGARTQWLTWSLLYILLLLRIQIEYLNSATPTTWISRQPCPWFASDFKYSKSGNYWKTVKPSQTHQKSHKKHQLVIPRRDDWTKSSTLVNVIQFDSETLWILNTFKAESIKSHFLMRINNKSKKQKRKENQFEEICSFRVPFNLTVPKIAHSIIDKLIFFFFFNV